MLHLGVALILLGSQNFFVLALRDSLAGQGCFEHTLTPFALLVIGLNGVKTGETSHNVNLLQGIDAWFKVKVYTYVDGYDSTPLTTG